MLRPAPELGDVPPLEGAYGSPGVQRWMDGDLWKVRNDVCLYIYITEITWRCEVQLCFNKYVYTYICPNFPRSISYGCFQKSCFFHPKSSIKK